jgi:hypothetical protein
MAPFVLHVRYNKMFKSQSFAHMLQIFRQLFGQNLFFSFKAKPQPETIKK